MADDERKSFWRRVKDKLTGQTPGPEQDKQDKSPATAADETTEQTPSPPSKSAGDSEPSVLSTSELKTDNVGRVYAEALHELSEEQGVTDALADEVQDLLPMIAEGGELHRLLTNPAIGDSARGEIIKRVFEGKVSPLLYKMLRVLGDKRRLGSLPEFAAGYLLAVAKARGQVDVTAYVATALDAQVSVRVAEQIGQALGKNVTLTQKVDPTLIGGMKIQVGDRLIDASVASQLRNMKNKMVAAERS